MQDEVSNLFKVIVQSDKERILNSPIFRTEYKTALFISFGISLALQASSSVGCGQTRLRNITLSGKKKGGGKENNLCAICFFL